MKRAVRDPHSQMSYFDMHSQGQSWLKKDKLVLQGSSSWPPASLWSSGSPVPQSYTRQRKDKLRVCPIQIPMAIIASFIAKKSLCASDCVTAQEEQLGQKRPGL